MDLLCCLCLSTWEIEGYRCLYYVANLEIRGPSWNVIISRAIGTLILFEQEIW